MGISEELLKILACPKCKNDITFDSAKDRLICKNCKVYYEIKDGIPIMLVEEAKPIEDANG
ncbi:MAG: Trm112 family protein [Deltaproteobacteria bacterium]|nr:MAG: Trm112 family protein [Deltaproteobacteria bacterium]